MYIVRTRHTARVSSGETSSLVNRRCFLPLHGVCTVRSGTHKSLACSLYPTPPHPKNESAIATSSSGRFTYTSTVARGNHHTPGFGRDLRYGRDTHTHIPTRNTRSLRDTNVERDLKESTDRTSSSLFENNTEIDTPTFG